MFLTRFVGRFLYFSLHERGYVALFYFLDGFIRLCALPIVLGLWLFDLLCLPFFIWLGLTIDWRDYLRGWVEVLRTHSPWGSWRNLWEHLKHDRTRTCSASNEGLSQKDG